MKPIRKVGRKPVFDAENRRSIRQLYRTGDFSVRELAVMMKVSRMTIWRYVNYEQPGNGAGI
ncbi:MAG: helix-turn-helix domain-containing protein [Candidatus Micrarchaeota archaeon]